MQSPIVPIDSHPRTNRKEVRTMTVTIYMQGIIIFVALFCGYGLAVSTPEEPAGASTPSTVVVPPKTN